MVQCAYVCLGEPLPVTVYDNTHNRLSGHSRTEPGLDSAAGVADCPVPHTDTQKFAKHVPTDHLTHPRIHWTHCLSRFMALLPGKQWITQRYWHPECYSGNI